MAINRENYGDKRAKKLIENEKAKLQSLAAQSSSVVDIVTSTIHQLESINVSISDSIGNIETHVKELECIRNELQTTSDKNMRVASKFKTLIEG